MEFFSEKIQNGHSRSLSIGNEICNETYWGFLADSGYAYLQNSQEHGVFKKYEIEGRLVRPALPFMLFRRYSIWIRNICLMYNYRVYNNLFWIFLIQMEYRLQSMYNHMVGQAASVVSPFYFILLGCPRCMKVNSPNCLD